MEEKKNEKKTIWIYAIVLFTSAFIVLLLTAYSQIKFNSNINEYKNLISNQEKDKSNFQLNLNSSLQENKNLKEEVKSLKGELAKNEEMRSSRDKNIDVLQKKYDDTVSEYEELILAQEEFDKGNIIECADILHSKIDYSLLEKSGKQRYDTLRTKTFDSAAKMLYINGYNSYIIKKYDEAIKNLQKSVEILPSGDYADDSYYFIAYSCFKKGDNEKVKDAAQKLISLYPKSSYKKDIIDLINKISK